MPPHSSRYPNYVLGILFLVYVSNFIDRQILTILVEPIKQEFDASDTQMGFLTGFAFALFYTFAGLPIARWADLGNRRSIIAMGLTVWSAMTALSGLAQSFFQLALARIGVGVGEAAGSPPAHSLIADYFPPERRAAALGTYAMGIYIGVMFGYLLGGWIKEFFDWRTAFLAVGLPGLVLALVVRFTVREPSRGAAERGPVEATSDSVADVARFLLAKKTFIYLSLGAALHAFVGYGFGSFVPAFLVRVHGMGYGEMGTWLGLISGLGGATGAYLGGRITDAWGGAEPRYYLWVPALSSLLGLPFVYPFLLMDDPRLGMLIYLPAVVFGAAYLGPTFAVTQALVKLRMRAVAAAILLFIINMIGLGAGPQVVGILSDAFTARVGVDGLRYALMIVGAANLLAAVFYLLAARHLKEDLPDYQND
jgi:predicted MFS family arabinose efflux permease